MDQPKTTHDYEQSEERQKLIENTKRFIQELFGERLPPGTRIKRSNGRTYEVQSDGSFRCLPFVFEKPWQPKI